MIRLLIDGYNLLPCTDSPDRDAFISTLVEYRRRKDIEVTVVFDGTHQGQGRMTKEFFGGVQIIYTPLTVTADDVIEGIVAMPSSEELVVVSSDRRIQSAARRASLVWIGSNEFARRLSAVSKPSEQTAPWLEGRTPDAAPPEKRPGHRLSKEESRRRRLLQRL